MYKVSSNKPVIAWWSGGITSSIACHICIQWFGIDNVRIIFIDTKSEDGDTYRFKADCEKWYGKEIEVITNENYENVEDVWIKHQSLNVATGAKCSEVMKISVRKKFETSNDYSMQAFGFDIDEIKRARAMSDNHPTANPFFPLLALGLTKKECLKMLPHDLFFSIKPPKTYELGFHNNNCFKRGCIQGGIGYWQKMKREFPDKAHAMALIEHKLTDLKGQPVTMLKDQGKDGGLVFLEPHPDYPNMKDISMMKGKEPKPLMECNGFCATNVLDKSETESEINYEYDNDR
jgi:hypothetical protein